MPLAGHCPMATTTNHQFRYIFNKSEACSIDAAGCK